MSNELIPVADIERMAAVIATSGLFGVKTKEQAFALMLISQAEGRHPAMAAMDYHIIQGRPALKADTILARFIEAGGRVEWHTYTSEKVEATFSYPASGSLRLAWTMDDAKRAGLAGKDNWKQYPRAQLRSRVISEGVRTVCPGVLRGVYTPEEVENFSPQPKYMGAVERVDEGEQPAAPPPEAENDTGVISVAQHRLIEARITELGLDRERVKAWVKKAWGVEHLTEIPAERFGALVTKLEAWAQKTAPDPRVTEAYARVCELRDALGWTPEDLGEWIAGQHYPAAVPLSDPVSLADMALKLQLTVHRQSARAEV